MADNDPEIKFGTDLKTDRDRRSERDRASVDRHPDMQQIQLCAGMNSTLYLILPLWTKNLSGIYRAFIAWIPGMKHYYSHRLVV